MALKWYGIQKIFFFRRFKNFQSIPKQKKGIESSFILLIFLVDAERFQRRK